MVTELKFVREDQTLYALDENGIGIGEWECRDDFEEGYNEYGQKRESLPNGTYDGPNGLGLEGEITDGAYGPSFGTFYITTGDPRGRDIHGGGSGCDDPYSDYQGWVPTYGCLRMQNADGKELVELINESDAAVILTVED